MNALHGWKCPTCGTERSEFEVGHGTAPVETSPRECFAESNRYGQHMWNDLGRCTHCGSKRPAAAA